MSAFYAEAQAMASVVGVAEATSDQRSPIFQTEESNLRGGAPPNYAREGDTTYSYAHRRTEKNGRIIHRFLNRESRAPAEANDSFDRERRRNM